MPFSQISALLTKRSSRSVLIIVFAALAVFSLIFFKPHAYDPVQSFSSLITPHTSFPNVVSPEGDDRAEIAANAASAAPPQRHLANATLFMLARNSEIDDAVRSVREVEDRFNHKYGYPWVFLNEQPFSYEFKRRLSNLASGPVHFGQIPAEHWYQPTWINETEAEEERHKMEAENVIYGGSVPYRNMCRFNSGFFYRHPLVQNFRYYWRIEPGVHFHCDVNIDPFAYLHENNKTYGFTVTLYEYGRTIETLWDTVHDFMTEYPEYVVQNNAMNFLSDNGGKDYNLCHFWSNFEIADMDFWRGEAYSAFFEYLDSQGGFYYERWGDAPVHTIAAALFAGTDRIHFFREIGYEHAPFMHCPAETEIWERDYHSYSCLWRWDRVFKNR